MPARRWSRPSSTARSTRAIIGPNPAINAFAQSDGQAIRIVSGATSGGAALIVRDDITSPDQLAGTVLATPQLGNTQDVALRAWLLEQGYETDLEGGGDVSITPQANADALNAFIAGDIDGAWVPEPWSTRMVEEGGGRVLVNEADLWPDGEFVTTHLIVATEFLEEHPDVVKGLVEGNLAAIDFTNDDPEAAQETVIAAIEELSGSELSPETVATAWENLDFTVDPIATSLATSAQHADRPRAPRPGRSRRHLRPVVPQRGAERGGPAGDPNALSAATAEAIVAGSRHRPRADRHRGAWPSQGLRPARQPRARPPGRDDVGASAASSSAWWVLPVAGRPPS